MQAIRNAPKGKIALVVILIVLTAVIVALLAPWKVRAVDGSGTNAVTPTSVIAGSTGNALRFTFTTSEDMSSGGFRITVPSDWSAPNATSGTPGYTTITGGSGIVARVLDAADSTTSWSAGVFCNSGLSASTSVKYEGTASIQCQTTTQRTGDAFYKTIPTENWSGYTTVGFWIRTSMAVASNRLQFSYASDSTLATPIASIFIPALTANTWTYVTVNLTGTRTSVGSFGIRAGRNNAVASGSVFVDDLLIGPGVPTFPGGGVITVPLLSAASGQTVVVTYGAGTSGGATAPTPGKVSTFTTASRTTAAGTYASIASSPTVIVDNPAPTLDSISPTNKNAGDSTFTLTATGTGFNASSVV